MPRGRIRVKVVVPSGPADLSQEFLLLPPKTNTGAWGRVGGEGRRGRGEGGEVGGRGEGGRGAGGRGERGERGRGEREGGRGERGGAGEEVGGYRAPIKRVVSMSVES